MKVKCRVCGQSIEKQVAKEVELRHWCCVGCLPKYFDISTPEGAERALYSYIWSLCEKNVNFSMLKTQIKRYKKENGWTFAGMYLTAKYFVDILNLEWDMNYGIGQLFNNNNYIEAQNYYKHKREIEEVSQNIELHEQKIRIGYKPKPLFVRNKHKMIKME